MPRTAHRMMVSVAASLLGHGALLLAAIGARLPRFESPIPIELLPTHRSIPKVGEQERRDERRAKPIASRKEEQIAQPAHQRPEKGKGTRAPLPTHAASALPATTDLSPYAPGDAHLVVLLRTSRLRHSPHRAAVELLLQALPDYQTLLTGTQISPLDDLDALLVATSDPRDVYATIVVAKHHVGPKMEALASRPLPEGDPRVFRLLPDERIVLLPKAEAEHFDKVRSAGGGAPDLEWSTLLDRFDRAGGPNAPALMVTLSEANSLVRLGGGLPTPRSALLAATAERTLSLRVELVFSTDEEAASFSSAWPSILERWHSMTRLVGLAPAFDGISLKTRGHTLELTGAIPEAQLRLGLSFAKALLPSNRVPTLAPPPPAPPTRMSEEAPAPATPLPEAPPSDGDTPAQE